MLLLLLAGAQNYTLSASGGAVTITGGASQRAANLDAQPGVYTITGGSVGDPGYTLTAEQYDFYIDTPDAALLLSDLVAEAGNLVTTFPDVTLTYEEGGGQSSQSAAQGGGGGGKAIRERGGAKIERWDAVELEDIYDDLLGIKKPDPVVKAAIKAVERVAGEKRPDPASVDWQAVAADESAAQALIEAEDAMDAFEAMEALLTMLAWDEAA